MARARAVAVAALLVVALGYGGICALMFLRQESLVFFPERAIAGTPADLGMAFEDVRFRAVDGVALAAWWVPAASARGSLVFAHGNGGNMSHRLAKIRLLHDLGLSVFAFDYRGYGASGGRPSEAGTYRDMDAAIDSVTREKSVPPARMLYLGESLGGAAAVEAASRRAPAGLILESTFTSVAAMAKVYYPWLPVRALVTIRYDSLARMPLVRCPVLVLHSPDDDVVPYTMGRELFAAAVGPKEFVALSGGHNGGGIAASPAARAALTRFVGTALAR